MSSLWIWINRTIKIKSTYIIKNKQAGHDINYLSYSGMLNTFGKDGNPMPFSNNLLADFAGGGSFGVLGILMALIER